MNRDKFRIEGVKVGLFDCKGNMVACGRTDCNGEAIFDGIPMGQYYVKQLECVNGFDQVGSDCVRVNLRRGNECDQVNFLSVQRHGAIKVTKWGFNDVSSCRFGKGNNCGCNNRFKDTTISDCDCNNGFRDTTMTDCGCNE